MKAGKIIAAIVGVIFALAAVGMVVGGSALVWAFGFERDADGFLTSPTYELDTAGYAITSEEVDLAARPGDWWPTGLADVRLEATSGQGDSLFVGIGPSADVDLYLGSVARDEVTRLGPERSDIRTRSLEGAAPERLPGEQGFWVASAEGTGTQTLTWEVEQGEWSVVVMNADASAGVDVAFDAGVRIPILFGIGVGLLIGGVLLGTLAAILLVLATRRAAEPSPAVMGESVGPYPVTLEATLDPGLSRWLWLVKWLLVIPHYIVLFFLFVAYALLTIVAFFAILFTGRYPRSIFDFNVGVLRWSWRVGYYAFSTAGTDQYPPFTLAATDYPARFDVAYPESLSRGLVLVKWWLLAIPHYLIVGLFTSGLVWWATDFGGDAVLEAGGGLIGILVLVAVIILAFTGRYPQGLFDLVIGLNRWVYRVAAYAGLMRDEYPPFRLDLGGEEPPGPAGGPEGPAPEPEARAKELTSH